MIASNAKPRPRTVGEDPLLTVSEVAGMLRLGKTKVYDLLNGGKLPRADFEGPLRIWRSDVQRFVDQRTSRPS